MTDQNKLAALASEGACGEWRTSPVMGRPGSSRQLHECSWCSLKTLNRGRRCQRTGRERLQQTAWCPIHQLWCHSTPSMWTVVPLTVQTADPVPHKTSCQALMEMSTQSFSYLKGKTCWTEFRNTSPDEANNTSNSVQFSYL